MDVERFLFGLRSRGVAPGLGPTRAALDALGAPDRRRPALQVAGTVGKGSTAAFAASILSAHGVRTGLFTSPHLVRFAERFRVDGVPVPGAEVDAALEDALGRAPWAGDPAAPAPEEARPLTFFEWCVVLAAAIFDRRRVEAAVMEVGLGGRWDATTAARADVVCVTRLDLDHTELLGETLEAVAAEKAGAVRPGRPVVTTDQPEGAARVLEASCRELEAPLLVRGRDFELVPEGESLRYAGPGLTVPELRLGLSGAHQVENAALAVASVAALFEALGRAPEPEAVRRGLAEVRWPGRLEEVRPGVFLDGAHNAVGIAALARALPAVVGPRGHLVFAVLADRDPVALLEPLLPWAETVTLTRAGGDRARDPADYAAAVRARHPRVRVVPEPAEALASARAEGLPVLACGSLYLVGALAAALEGRRTEAGDPPLVPQPR